MFSKACDFFYTSADVRPNLCNITNLIQLIQPWANIAMARTSRHSFIIELVKYALFNSNTPFHLSNTNSRNQHLSYEYLSKAQMDPPQKILLRSFRKTSCICSCTFYDKSHDCELLQIAIYFLLSVSWWGCGPKLGIFLQIPMVKCLFFRLGKPLAVSFLARFETRFLPEDPVPEVHETCEAPEIGWNEGNILFTYFDVYIYIYICIII